jgi:hypothetical protein
MSFKQKLTGFGFFFLLVILILFFTLTTLYFYIPTYVKSKLIPEIAQKAGIQNYAYDIRRIGFFGADFGSVRIGTDKHPVLSIASIQIDYSPKELYKNAVRRTILSGVELFCEYKNGELKIRNFDLKNLSAKFQSSKNTTSSSIYTSQTLSIGRLEIRNSVVVFEFKGKTLRLPIELEIVPVKTDRNGFKGVLRLYPRDQEIVFAANIQIIKKQILLKMDALKVHLERFADFTSFIPGLALSGEVDINGEASFQVKPFKVTSASALCQFRNPEFTYNNFILKNFQTSQKEKRPLKIEIKGTGGKEWKIFGSAVSAVSPLPFQATDMNCELSILEDAVTVSGDLNIASEELNHHKIIFAKVLKPFNIKGNYFAKLEKNGKWEFRIHHTAKKPSRASLKTCKFRIHGIDIVSNLPVIDVSGKGEHAKGAVTFKLEAPNVKTTARFGTIQIPSVSLKGETRFNNASKKARHRTTFKLKAPNTTLTMASTKVKLPIVLLGGELWEGKDHALNFDSLVKFNNSSLSDSKFKTKINGINGSIPLKWPLKRTGKEGNYFVKQFLWEDRNLGSVKGTVQQKGNGFIFRGAHNNLILKGLSLYFTGNTKILSRNDYEAGIHFQTGHYKTSADIDLGQFLSFAKGTTFNGEAEIEGDIFFNRTGIKSPTRIRLNNATVALNEKDAKIEGIQLTLHLTDLFRMKSAPKQLIRFENASLGALKVSSGKIEYQVESDRSFFIENSSFKWCGGHVYYPAVRISPKTKDYHLILYCDRLNLPMILEQLGGVNAEGIGTVNGRLPIQVKNGKIRFSDGFLFSTPGEGGKIHVTGTEMLTAGIPRNTPQYVQLELAREALKDYDYDWAKLNLKTEGDNAVLRLQLNGKPSKPLPFVYNKEIGGFAKVDVGNKGSIFQGIRLDVNFRVPLDKILHYKDILDMIKE